MIADEYVFFLVDSPKLSGVKNEVIPFAKCVYNKNGDFKMMPVKGFNKIKEGLSILNRLPLEFNFMKDGRLLPAILRNRLLNKKRPEYDRFMGWMNIDLEEGIEKDINVLFQMMGVRTTDSTVVYPKPIKINDKEYVLNFFLNNSKWYGDDSWLKENLYIRENETDFETPPGYSIFKTIFTRSNDVVVDVVSIGDAPYYFSDCFNNLKKTCEFDIKISLKKFNLGVKYFQVLLEAKITSDEDLNFYQGEDYEVIE